MGTNHVFQIRTLPLIIPFLLPGLAPASSFQILEQSPAKLGQAYSGTASDIRDASTVFFNPAGMSQLEGRHLTAGVNIVWIEGEFDDRNSNTGGSGGGTDEVEFVPNLYYVQPLTEDWTLGLGISAPFGLKSDYGREWIGRYLATDSELEALNFNATFAYDINHKFSVALGLNYQRVETELSNAFDSTFGINPAVETDSLVHIVDADDSDLILDLSMFFQPTETTRLGLIWRQGADFDLEGEARFERNGICTENQGYPTGAPPAPSTGTLCANALAAREGAVAANISFPDTVTISISHKLTSEWSVHGDLAWTEWSEIGIIEIISTGNEPTLVDKLALEYDDTVRVALGATYDSYGPWVFRFGVAFDEAPQTSPEFVSARILDGDRIWVSLGFSYIFSDQLSVDVGYAHLFLDDVDIQDRNPGFGHVVDGDFNTRANTLGIQGNWHF